MWPRLRLVGGRVAKALALCHLLDVKCQIWLARGLRWGDVVGNDPEVGNVEQSHK